MLLCVGSKAVESKLVKLETSCTVILLALASHPVISLDQKSDGHGIRTRNLTLESMTTAAEVFCCRTVLIFGLKPACRSTSYSP